MAISEQARKDHDWLAPDELFPYHLSTVKVNDPELIEYFDNFTFVFDEVLDTANLDTGTRFVVLVATLVGCQALSVMLGAALTVDVTPSESRRSSNRLSPIFAALGERIQP